MGELTADWYSINNINEIDSPALLVYPERIKQNIATAVSMVNRLDLLRPHVKTNKCAEVAQLMQDAGITKFKCATIAEAEMLGMTGAKDVLLAYQPTGPKLERFIAVVQSYPSTTWSCLVDNLASAQEISNAFLKFNPSIPVYIDLNTGMNRTGIEPGLAFELYEKLAAMPGIQIAGLHAYDGHMTDPDIMARTEQCNKAFEQVMALKEKIVAAGMTEPVIIAGGSPSFPVHALRKDIECSPGTFVYWDKSYLDNCAEQSFLPAAVLVTRVISKPSPGLISVDLGHKSVAAENVLANRVSFLNATGLTPVGQSEEHLVLKVDDADKYEIGDVLYAIPFHVCPTVALYEKVHVAENAMATKSWRTIARDRIIIH